ncbi:MAG: hypothetical protein B7C24_06260 [Bacteroidetes bacterium 4572_77]|nr:MAG: hypothetical protein B7C24_06260 [Bacteroidetes bacterium 4572_77]
MKAFNSLFLAFFLLANLANMLIKLDSLQLKRMPNIKWVEKEVVSFKNQNRLLYVNLKTEEISVINSWEADAENKEFSSKHDVAYTLGNNLYISSNGEKTTLTMDSMPGIVNGQTVHRSEFGIKDGIFWSPKGNALAFYHKDESMVKDYPLVDITAREAEVENTKYPMAGMTNEVVKLGVYNLKTQETIFMQTGDSVDHYLTSVSWGPNEAYIYIGILNREQNHLWLNKYNAQDGSFVQTLFEEQSNTWVEPEKPLYFLQNRDDQFIWFSERNGWMHMYIYNTQGQFVKQLTQGEWMVNDFLGFDKSGNTAFFSSTKESPIQKQIYSVGLKNTKVKKITKAHGTHRAIFNTDKSYFIDIYSSTDVASAYELRGTNGKIIKELQKDENSLENYNLGELSLGTLENEEGDELYYRLIKPANFDSTKQYPVFFYLYGGPHAQMITDSWMGGANMFMQLMAQRGYVVFTIDNRGTPNRGFAFENIIHRKLGKYEMEDQLVGVDFLLEQSWVDANRMGIQGWSYGGFMTINMMLSEPGLFKAGVAGGPVIDWEYYEIMYGERYMDMPSENPEGYKSNNLKEKAHLLEDHLLIIQGAIDPTVVWQNSLTFIQKAIEEGKPIDYFVYPRAQHNVRGKHRAHLLEKIYLYLEMHLN